MVGSISDLGIGQKRYYIIINDDYTRYQWTTPLVLKSKAFHNLKAFFALMANKYSIPIVDMHMDNGFEYGGKKLIDFLAQQGCQLLPTTPYHHEQQGIAECANGIITSKARTMIIGSKLPKQLWPKVVVFATYLTNHSPTTSNPGSISSTSRLAIYFALPYIFRFDRLHAYGAIAYVHIALETRPKGSKFTVKAHHGYC